MSVAVYSTFCGTQKGNNAFVVYNAVPTLPCFMYSNNEAFLEEAAAKGWRPVLLPQFMPPTDDQVVSAAQSKFAKTRPDLLPELADYEYTWYVDTKVELETKFLQHFLTSFIASGAPLAARRHWYLEPNVEAELEEALKQPRYKQQEASMRAYIERRLACTAFQAKAPLYASGLLLRSMRHPDIARINAMWEDDTKQCGTECQLTLFFVAQTTRMFTLPFDMDKQHVNLVLHHVRVLDELPRKRASLERTSFCIPRMLHMFWLMADPVAPQVVRHLVRWQLLMPSWRIKLWLLGDEDEFGPRVKERVAEAKTQLQRADIMRVHVLRKYGGIAVHDRVIPVNSLEPVIQMNQEFILCHWRVVNCTYIQCDLVAAAPGVNVLNRVCEIVDAQELNTYDTEMTTGACAMGLGVETCAPPAGTHYIILPPQALYRNDPAAFGNVVLFDNTGIDLNHALRTALCAE